MKIALFSDIHANLPALEAFFNDLERVAKAVEDSILPIAYAEALRIAK
nr:hypothetical protein [Allomuricauda sp.]|tara:strand:- start:196 stop:339 length:144 start_codon:yes stop_codon:yes gene_type:complete